MSDATVRKYEKQLTKAQRKEQRRSDRDREANAMTEVSRASKVRIPQGVNVRKLDSDDLHLLRETPGYDSNKGYLGGLFKGKTMLESMDDMRTPFFDDWDPVHVIRSVEALLCDPRMTRRENQFMAKVGPYFLKDYSDWCHKVHAVYEPKQKDWDQSILDHSIATVALRYSSLVPKLMKALSPNESGFRIKCKSSTGYPFFTKNWHQPLLWGGEEVVPFTWGMAEAQGMVESGDYDSLDEHLYTLFTRKAPRGITETDKTSERAVQCSPMVERFLGIGIQQGMLDVMKRNPFSVGLQGVEAMPPHIRAAMSKHDVAFEADYSNFDATIHPELITRVMLEVILPLFEESDHPRIHALAEFYANAELWTPAGVLWSEDGPGLLSGSMLTNVLGTIIGEIAFEYFVVKVRESGETFDHTTFGYGDDLAVFVDTSIPTDKIAEVFSRYVAELNLVAHPEKQWVSEGTNKEISFLGCVFFDSDPLCNPVYPMMRLLSKMIWFEHFGNVGDEGDHRVIYEADGLTYTEKLLNGVIGRLDVSHYNASWEGCVEFFRQHCRITVEKCKKFLPDPTVSPTLNLVAGLEVFYPLPADNYDAECDPLTDEEQAELEQLAQEARDDIEGRNILRRFKRSMKLSVKAMRKVRASAENGSTASAGTPGEPGESGPDQNAGTAKISPDEELLLAECLNVASDRKKRSLLYELRAWKISKEGGQ